MKTKLIVLTAVLAVGIAQGAAGSGMAQGAAGPRWTPDKPAWEGESSMSFVTRYRGDNNKIEADIHQREGLDAQGRLSPEEKNKLAQDKREYASYQDYKVRMWGPHGQFTIAASPEYKAGAEQRKQEIRKTLSRAAQLIDDPKTDPKLRYALTSTFDGYINLGETKEDTMHKAIYYMTQYGAI